MMKLYSLKENSMAAAAMEFSLLKKIPWLLQRHVSRSLKKRRAAFLLSKCLQHLLQQVQHVLVSNFLDSAVTVFGGQIVD